ncbi:bis(5'-nucleosyl)-tetraphosphatase (symmetrical) YqeK [Fischerella thermalis]|uniref:bis(5'-nucleosyl)-tetraphosphatase (symmetrical) YqeK n=1 Tax=Fischerella thermalis TaxID=372787 RepID=UPI000C7FE5C5|nr:bis(5'-nucleosyl)-tetraphosphatase (symmetrical) YqeK [Fischerella thermalis]PMB08551.1 phosphohydrolase [Fischerella thermalis CCMEE 5328]PMB40687.1 phosphohydrolase [Fischerella thermalis CCMEE 5205]MBF1991061.1 bis(5'-nucleosyl)-tetraphosphatase (symmetrical) YqeK [Fischerella thermalis M58_A2018_009]MBF2070946.1 bis(5'-nucleosyl)-tetraphosphatase (symmetrical) YqeK [Fischerella thermalis M48_A2018_028]PLZ85423.1 phosphohydrolase [Fischerella thermalis CCMEE 5194]
MRQKVLAWLAENVPSSRINHILRVEQMAVELAQHYQLDREKAATAGLMHDLAKYFPSKKLLQMAELAGLEIDEVMVASPHLLHADVSAIIARESFGVQDEEVLQAIANHTLGRPGMSPLSCIVFLADTLEPGRGDSAELQALRKTSFANLERAVWLTCDYTFKFLLESPSLIHPRAVATRNWFLQKSKTKQPVITTTV